MPASNTNSTEETAGIAGDCSSGGRLHTDPVPGLTPTRTGTRWIPSRSVSLAALVLLSALSSRSVPATGAEDRPAAGADAQNPADAQRLADRLGWWQQQKFGLFVHWGAYSQLGCIESWPLVFKDRAWSNPEVKTLEEMQAFHKKYWALNTTFNPTEFDPQVWADAARYAGMKYVVFTTKHHDGFCMYDSQQTAYKVTGPDCPYSSSPQPDITRRVFETFRRQGFAIGCYFSKSDWHHPDYWSTESFPQTRNPNYDTALHPEKWSRFTRFVHGQVEELMSGYGHVDILWLDGGQVRPPMQDIQMDRLVGMARRHQPHLIVVDRAAGTQHENYRTPEQEVPDQPLPYPWETCMTMGKQWSFKPDDEYKSSRELIHLLVDVVAKGGNFLLNLGAQPDGKLPAPGLARLKEIGDWMAINAEAIHGTQPIAPYKEANIALTSRGTTVYATYLAGAQETGIPETVRLSALQPAAGTVIRLLGVEQPLAWRIEDKRLLIEIPEKIRTQPPCKHAYVFQVAPGK